MAVDLRVESAAIRWLACQTRLPFRFGAVTMTQAPALVARVVAQIDGRGIVGYASDLAVPKWFNKDASKSARNDMADLISSAERAGDLIEGRSGSAFGIWLQVYREALGHAGASGVPLLDGFGVALVERAMIDAVCRAAGRSFKSACEEDFFGFDAGSLLPEAGDLQSKDLVVPRVADRLQVRHTVGGLDPLRVSDVPSEFRSDDTHPVALEEDIQRYGLKSFKLKIGAGPEADRARLVETFRVIESAGVSNPVLTLDGNEQYPDLEELDRLLDRLEADTDGRRLLENLLYIEQPLPRDRTLAAGSHNMIASVGARFPLIIDEADHDIDTFAKAAALGYRGVSVKNCKGIFRALANRALCLASDGELFQTSEDLTNLPVLALQQDLTFAASIGLDHTERNGHHFFPGLDVLPTQEAESALAHQPDLYERRGAQIGIRIEDGSLSVSCQNSEGFGYRSEIDWASRHPSETFFSEPEGENE